SGKKRRRHRHDLAAHPRPDGGEAARAGHHRRAGARGDGRRAAAPVRGRGAREPRLRGHGPADRLWADDLAALRCRPHDRMPGAGPRAGQGPRSRHRLRLPGGGAGEPVGRGIFHRAHPRAAGAGARQPARPATEKPAARAWRRRRGAGKGRALRFHHPRGRRAATAAGPLTATGARWQNDPAVARRGSGGAAAGARGARRARLYRNRAGSRTLRSAPRRKGLMRPIVFAAAVGAALIGAGCAITQRPAPVDDRRAATTAQPRLLQPAPAQSAAPRSYVVKRGDTLYSIAMEQGVDYRELAQANRIDDPGKLRVGQELRLPPSEERAPVQVGTARGAAEIESRPLGASTSGAAAPSAPPQAAADGSMKTSPKALRLPYSEQNLASLSRGDARPEAKPEARPEARPESARPPPSMERDPDAIDFAWPARG